MLFCSLRVIPATAHPFIGIYKHHLFLLMSCSVSTFVKRKNTFITINDEPIKSLLLKMSYIPQKMRAT